MSDRVLVTGAAGFVGANLARRLLADGADVHLLLAPNTDLWRLRDLLDDATVWTASLEDAQQVRDAVGSARPDRVFHLAAHGAYPYQRDAHRITQVNLLGTMHLVEACLEAGARSFVHTGSSSEYGYKDHAPTEREWTDPNSHYAVSKAAATMYCRLMSLTSGTPITTLRLYSVYGPWEERTRLMPTLVANGMRGALPPLVSPHIARDYVYVDDVVDACVLAAQASVPLGSVFNVATGVQTSLADLVGIVGATQHVRAEPQWGSMPPRSWDTDVWVGDPAAIADALEWRASVPVADGYARFVDWMADPAHGRHYDAARHD
jgi:dolichol-phosphate mannosyltransferase